MNILRRMIGRLMNFLEARSAARGLARLLRFKGEATLTVGGHRMSAHTPDRILALVFYKLGLMAREEERLMRRELKPGMTALDVGGNIGFHALLFARLVGPEGRVYSFEPDPDNFSLLEKNVAANGYANVRCHRVAVSDRNGTADFYFCEEHRGDHRLYDPKDGRRSFPVETVRLDDFLPPDLKIDFIKLDIQGAEMRALEGMRKLLRRNGAVRVLSEFSPRLLSSSGASPEGFLRYWAELGFKTFFLPDGSDAPEPADARRLMKLAAGGYLNIYLRRE